MSVSSENIFDSIIIGSSPVALIESIHLASLGKRVLLLEKKDRLGGAWGTIKLGSFENLELGPHIIKPRPGLYQLLKDLGIKLIPMSPPPIRAMDHKFFGHKFIPFDWRWFELSRASIKNASFLYKPYLVIHFFFSILKNSVRKFIFPDEDTLCYLKGGSQEMVNHLSKLAQLAGVQINMNTSVLAVHVNSLDGQVMVHSESDVFQSAELIYTSGSQLQDVTIDKIEVDFNDPMQTHVELLLLIDDAEPSSFSFANFPYNDPVVRMISDITPYTIKQNDNSNIKVIAIRIRDEIMQEQSTIDCVFDRLKEFCFIGKNACLSNYKWIVLPIPFRRIERITELNNITMPWLRGLYTYDIGVSILTYAERWTDTLAKIKEHNGYSIN